MIIRSNGRSSSLRRARANAPDPKTRPQVVKLLDCADSIERPGCAVTVGRAGARADGLYRVLSFDERDVGPKEDTIAAGFAAERDSVQLDLDGFAVAVDFHLGRAFRPRRQSPAVV